MSPAVRQSRRSTLRGPVLGLQVHHSPVSRRITGMTSRTGRLRMRYALRIGLRTMVAAIIIAPFSLLAAQATTRGVPSTYAITNARIVTGTGPPMERGTVVVRNGLIAAVGAGVAVPADARIIDGNGL